MRNFILLQLLFTLSFAGYCQNGRISGIIVDSKTGETLPGATVLIEGTTIGAQADFDGKFAINNVPEGKVTLVISYISYTTKKISDVFVSANDATSVNIQLDPSSSQDLAEVEVVVTLNKENNTALILQQKNNASVSDGISAETIKRTPDRNTSDVLKRVSGASIQDNKFAIVRGLNDRYNAAYLNGSPLPSTESDRKAFSFDIFPSNMLDNLVIIKTARADMPGEFAGGIIDINTKNIPEKNFISISAGGGFNTITTGKQRLYYKGGKTDWLGIDDGTRSMPAGMPDFKDFPVDIHKQAALAQNISVSDWGIYQKKFAPNASFQIAAGANIKRHEKDFFGIIGSLSYNNNNSFFSTDRITYQSGRPNDPDNPLLLDKTYYDKTYQTQKLAGALLNMSVKLNENNSISSKNLFSISSDDRLIYRTGSTTPNENNPNMIKSSAFWFTQNIISTSQLIGDHYLPKSKLRINWNGSISNVRRDIPNMRRHLYQRLTYMEVTYDADGEPMFNPNDTVWTAQLGTPKSNSSDYGGIMLWSKMREQMKSFKADASRSFKLNDQWSIEGKTGGLVQFRNRTFDFRQFIYSPYEILGGTTSFSTGIAMLPEDQIFTQQNMGLIKNGNGSGNNQGGFLLGESTYPESPYRANSSLYAGFAMADIKYKTRWRMIGGIRYESYMQRLSYNDILYMINEKVNTIDTLVNDILPSLNLIYSPTDKINLRGSYSKTINRPEFRELAPFLFYDFNTNFSLNGDPKLKRSLIDNYDLRAEWFPGGGQLISVSGFYKKFENPIELFKAQNTYQVEYRNVPSAYVRGVEFEYRVNAGSFHKNDSGLFGKILNNLTVFSNLALMKSEVDVSRLPGATYKRPLQGQSPYLFNAGVSYVDTRYNYSFSAVANRIGPRIYIVGNNLFQEIWEYSRTVIDLQATKTLFKNRLEIRFNVRDLLAKGQPLKYLQNFDSKPLDIKNGNYTTLWYTKLGTTYSGQITFKF